MQKMKYTGLWVAVLALFLTACSGNKDKSQQTDADGAPLEVQVPVEDLYNQAADALDRKQYLEAKRLFEEVERQYPYSKWATKSKLMASYAAYEADRYDEAILGLDRFIELHPGNEDIDYAHYLKALAYYEQISDVARDQKMTELSLKAFDTLITRFPNSDYTRDAKLKRDLTLDHLAGKEMEIGRYYLNRGQVNGGLNRFRTVIEDYQTTTHVPEALHRLVESYLILGLESEAVRVAAVLGHNYPGSEWYADSYKILKPESRQQLIEDRSFVDKTIDSLFKPD
ncbi:MAG: outer membrane protein assembly factor BamD [Alphaproteobacteria bacterium]|nr:outer membrane protein assembly factor BamD [Alphaproteobacteria bacterium]NCQ87474.1 outer membrane protein assembly factor BamD [Alphaproteobacteria bacterium]NCT06345.1 outer membrane protein assembly factor BamD [Alphaproteobacteria bacterium]